MKSLRMNEKSWHKEMGYIDTLIEEELNGEQTYSYE